MDRLPLIRESTMSEHKDYLKDIAEQMRGHKFVDDLDQWGLFNRLPIADDRRDELLEKFARYATESKHGEEKKEPQEKTDLVGPPTPYPSPTATKHELCVPARAVSTPIHGAPVSER